MVAINLFLVQNGCIWQFFALKNAEKYNCSLIVQRVGFKWVLGSKSKVFFKIQLKQPVVYFCLMCHISLVF